MCEASSFQLEMSTSLKPFISVWTNFTPDHIDWHQGLENYFKAKARVFLKPQAPKYSVLNAKDERLLEFAKQAQGEVFMFAGNIGNNCCYEEDGEIVFKKGGVEEKIIKLSECPLLGEHNYQNIMCAIICAKLTGIDNATIKQAIIDFKAPAHRLEKIYCAFFDDQMLLLGQFSFLLSYCLHPIKTFAKEFEVEPTALKKLT